MFQDQVKLTTGLDIKTPDRVKEAEEEEKETRMPPEQSDIPELFEKLHESEEK